MIVKQKTGKRLRSVDIWEGRIKNQDNLARKFLLECGDYTVFSYV